MKTVTNSFHVSVHNFHSVMLNCFVPHALPTLACAFVAWQFCREKMYVNVVQGAIACLGLSSPFDAFAYGTNNTHVLLFFFAHTMRY